MVREKILIVKNGHYSEASDMSIGTPGSKVSCLLAKFISSYCFRRRCSHPKAKIIFKRVREEYRTMRGREITEIFSSIFKIFFRKGNFFRLKWTSSIFTSFFFIWQLHFPKVEMDGEKCFEGETIELKL